jgi:hypothetical protein
MSTFRREFPVARLDAAVLDRAPWFVDMLRAWRPAGDALDRAVVEKAPTVGDPLQHLRVAIRDGYLNVYCGGQSIGSVSLVRGALQSSIHHKYLGLPQPSAGHYLTVRSGGVPDATRLTKPYEGAEQLRRWMSNACAYVGDEKRFVDGLVANNPNVIDLEAGLPAIGDDRTAPRMDLVALEPFGAGWRVVFWEAKLASNGEARCSGDAAPKVVGQLARYTDWLRQPGHCEIVAAAYQETCRLLVGLHAIARGLNPQIGPLGDGIVAVAAEGAPLPCIDDRPRLVIDDRGENRTFVRNGHLDKLRGPCGVWVQDVTHDGELVLVGPPVC